MRGGKRAGAFDNLSADCFLDGWAFRRGRQAIGECDVCAGECGRSDFAGGGGIYVNAHGKFESRIVGAVLRVRGDAGIFGDDKEL